MAAAAKACCCTGVPGAGGGQFGLTAIVQTAGCVIGKQLFGRVKQPTWTVGQNCVHTVAKLGCAVGVGCTQKLCCVHIVANVTSAVGVGCMHCCVIDGQTKYWVAGVGCSAAPGCAQMKVQPAPIVKFGAACAAGAAAATAGAAAAAAPRLICELARTHTYAPPRL